MILPPEKGFRVLWDERGGVDWVVEWTVFKRSGVACSLPGMATS